MKKKLITLVIPLLAIVVLCVAAVRNTFRGPGLVVTYVDVGQGDCQIVMCDGKSMLIDGGMEDKGSTVVSVLGKLGISYLDYVVCTHAHADHCGGLAGALSAMDAEVVLAPKSEEDTEAYKNFKKIVQSKGIKITHTNPGDVFDLGGSKVEVLGPITEDTDELNNTSLVLKISYGKTSFLFTADAESDEEHDIINSGADLRADVLKVGHHGSSGSSSYSFLREVMPKFAIIGVGKDNSYGHPHDNTLSRLRDVGATVYRTDMQGDITAVSDGRNITITTSKGSNAFTNPTEVPEDEALYIGNKNSKKLHKPDCSGLPDEHNREYFVSRIDAVDQGYIPCKNCTP